MDASGSQTLDQWDDISDSELLAIALDQHHTESPIIKTGEQLVKSECQSVSGSSVQRTNESSDADMRKTTAVRGMKRKSLHEGLAPQFLRFQKQHLSVTLLCDQSWCELKTVHGLRKPSIKRKDMKRFEVQIGKHLHSSREREIQDVVPVQIYSREDAEAVKFFNVLTMVPRLGAGECVRELPVFGVQEGVLICGVIDELRYDQKGALVLNELKTRRHNCLPSAAQDKVNCFQVSLYKLLFDDLVRGNVKKDDLLNHLNLRSTQVLGAKVLDHATSIGVHVTTMEDLVDACLMSLSCSDLPCIDLLQLEYCHQASNGQIGIRVAPFEETQVRAELRGFLDYWTGQREARGVDIEEAWKCRSCLFEPSCDWTRTRSSSDQQANHAL